MKQISHLKQLFAGTLLLLSFVVVPGGLVNPQFASAAACITTPASDSQATAQMLCVEKYINACKKGYDKGFCDSLSVDQINRCAQTGTDPKFKASCMKGLQNEYRASAAPSTTAVLPKKNDCNSSDLSKDNCGIINMIVVITNIMAGLAGLVIVGTLIWGGILYSSAGSDPSKIQAAKSKIVAGITALLVLIFGFSIIQWLVPGGLF